MKKTIMFILVLMLLQISLKAQLKFEQTIPVTAADDYLYTQTLDSTNTRFVASGYSYYGSRSYGKSILIIKWDNLSMGYDNALLYTGPGVRDEEGRYIMKTSDGGYLVVGNTNSYKTATDDDAFAMKTNSLGIVQWFKVFGGAYTDIASSSCEDKSYYYVAGTSNETSGSTYRGIVYCFNKTTGAVVWAKNYKCATTNYWQTFSSIIIGHDGNLIIGGYVLTGIHNPVCLKINKSNGSIIWSYRYAIGTTKCIVSNVVKGPGTSYIVTGTRNFTTGYGDVLLFNITDNGVVNWSKYYNGGNIDYGIQTTYQSNRYITTGYTHSFGSDDQYLLKTDTNGIFSWGRLYHSTTTQEGYNWKLGTRPLIDMGNTGFSLVSGKYDATYALDAYLLSIDNQGRTGCEFDSVFTATSFSFTRYTLTDTLNNVTAKDTTITKIILNPPYDTICSPDTLSAKRFAGIGELKVNYNEIAIYPNPSNGLINLIIDPAMKASEIEIYDLRGNLVYSRQLSVSSNVDLTNLGKGLYLARIIGLNITYTKRIIIE